MSINKTNEENTIGDKVLDEAEVFQILTDTADYQAPVEYNPELISDAQLNDLLREADEDRVTAVSEIVDSPSAVAVIETDDEEDARIQEDFEKAQKNVNGFLDMSQTAMKELLALARASDNPDVYQALNQMMKTAADINSSLIDNHTKKKRAKEKAIQQNPQQGNQPPVQANQQNNYYVGTTAELAKMLKDMGKQ